MNIGAIATLPIEPHMPADVKQLRKRAPDYLRSIIEKGKVINTVRSLAHLNKNNLKALAGGMLSAVYWLKESGDELVVKLRYYGVKAEAEALNAWAREGASVVNVVGFGVVPATKNVAKKVKYLVLEGVTDSRGEIAPTAQSYVWEHPESAYKIGTLLGEELAKIHRAKTERCFGEYADMWGKNKSPYKSWNTYCEGFLEVHKGYLLEHGLTETKYKKLIEHVRNQEFDDKGTYLHGDFSLRNSMLEFLRPYRIRVFDPNPLVGDPSWDIAILYNNEEYARRKHDFQPRNSEYKTAFSIENDVLNGFIKGYGVGSGKEIDTQAVWLSQLLQSIFLMEIEENKARKRDEEPHESVEVMVRHDTLFSKIEKLIS